jgi:hypothetical protein
MDSKQSRQEKQQGQRQEVEVSSYLLKDHCDQKSWGGVHKMSEKKSSRVSGTGRPSKEIEFPSN